MIFVVILYVLKGICKPFVIMISKIPGVQYVNSRIENLKDSTNQKIQTAKETAFRSGILILTVGTIIWLAVFMYLVFYYTYIPSLTHIRPVYLQFQTCDDPESSICSFPTAHVELTKRQSLLMVGQSYKMYLNFEMPESDANKKLGMFMVCLELNDKDGKLVANSCRPVMLHYKSWLLHTMKTLIYAPFLLLGTAEEKQHVTVEMFSDYEEDQNRPITDMYVEIQTKKIELYSATMQIHAHFTGLRYLMFHWPILSAVVGISTNLLLVVFVFLLSWYHLFYGKENTYRYTSARKFRAKISSLTSDADIPFTKSKLEDASPDDSFNLEEKSRPESSGIKS